jgi:IMP cyclohydrolase
MAGSSFAVILDQARFDFKRTGMLFIGIPSEGDEMTDRLEQLASRAYPGRLIIMGRSPGGESIVVVYAVTGRSPSSQARELVRRDEAVWTQPTDPEVLAKGNPDLLVYPALVFGRGIAVGNGKQTSDIDLAGAPGPAAALEAGLRAWSFEPDAPIYTPRISGCALPGGTAGLAVIRRGSSGAVERLFAEFDPAPGEGRMISTYAGENADPLASFCGEPILVGLAWETARATAEAVDAALGPKPGGPDFRVSVACAFARLADLSAPDLALINRRERTSS